MITRSMKKLKTMNSENSDNANMANSPSEQNGMTSSDSGNNLTSRESSPEPRQFSVTARSEVTNMEFVVEQQNAGREQLKETSDTGFGIEDSGIASNSDRFTAMTRESNVTGNVEGRVNSDAIDLKQVMTVLLTMNSQIGKIDQLRSEMGKIDQLRSEMGKIEQLRSEMGTRFKGVEETVNSRMGKIEDGLKILTTYGNRLTAVEERQKEQDVEQEKRDRELSHKFDELSLERARDKEEILEKLNETVPNSKVDSLAQQCKQLSERNENAEAQIDILKVDAGKQREQLGDLSVKVDEMTQKLTSLCLNEERNSDVTAPVHLSETEEFQQLNKRVEKQGKFNERVQKEYEVLQRQVKQIQNDIVGRDGRGDFESPGTVHVEENNLFRLGNVPRERLPRGFDNNQYSEGSRQDSYLPPRSENFDYKHFLSVRKFKVFRNSNSDIHPCSWLDQFAYALPPNWPLSHKLEFMCGYLENEPAMRMRSVIRECNSLNDFYHAFLSAYWSENTQDRIKHSLIMQRNFEQSEFSTPAKYFDDMVRKNQFLSNPYSPNELIRICLTKMPQRIRHIVLAGRCKDDIENFQTLLQELEFDNDDGTSCTYFRNDNQHRDPNRRGRDRNRYSDNYWERNRQNRNGNRYQPYDNNPHFYRNQSSDYSGGNFHRQNQTHNNSNGYYRRANDSNGNRNFYYRNAQRNGQDNNVRSDGQNFVRNSYADMQQNRNFDNGRQTNLFRNRQEGSNWHPPRNGNSGRHVEIVEMQPPSGTNNQRRDVSDRS